MAKTQLFFEVPQLHRQLADLLIQPSFNFFLPAVVTCSAVAKDLREPFQSLLLPLVDLRGMNAVFSRNLVDGLVSGNRLNCHPGLKLPRMLPSLCHNSLLSDPTIPQQHYLIHWSEKPGVLYVHTLRDKGTRITSQKMLFIRSVIYLGDEGGIGCDLGIIGDEKEAIVCSLTHLSLNPRHPLAREIRAYQRERKKRLAQQDYVELN